jgi:hypothetical protein
MAKSEDSKMEAETIIRWDETDELAILWTASPKVRDAWNSYLFPVTGDRNGGGWRCRVPKDRISYKTFKK